MKDEDITAAVYQAAYDYVTSVVPPKMIYDLDISVVMEDAEITIDILLATDRPEEVDQRTVDEAIKIASEKADELMSKKS